MVCCFAYSTAGRTGASNDRARILNIVAAGRSHYRSDEPVTAARHRLNKSWIVGVVIERGPQLLQDHIETAVEIDVCAVGPKVLPKHLAADKISPCLQQKDQDPKRLLLDFDSHSIAREGVVR